MTLPIVYSNVSSPEEAATTVSFTNVTMDTSISISARKKRKPFIKWKVALQKQVASDLGIGYTNYNKLENATVNRL